MTMQGYVKVLIKGGFSLIVGFLFLEGLRGFGLLSKFAIVSKNG